MAMAVDCVGCGKRYRVRDELAGKRVRCDCGRELAVPVAALAANATMADVLDAELAETVRPVAPAGQSTCPECGARLPGGAVLCVQCGYHLYRRPRFTRRRAAAIELRDERPDGDSPRAAPRGLPDAAVHLDVAFQGILWLVFSFRGRIPRRLFLMSKLALPAILLLMVLPVAIMLPNTPAAKLAVAAAFIVFTWGSLAVQTKRWHDRNHPGWYMLINAIPLVGPVYTIIQLYLLRGTVGSNKYGEDPT